MNEIIQERIQDTQTLINTNAELQVIIKNNQLFWDQIKNYNMLQLVQEIQPRWNTRNTLSKKEMEKLTLLMLAYRLLGLDPEYFTCGVGASSGSGNSNCLII